MLPQLIVDEIFNLKYQINELAIDHVCDELQCHGCVVDSYHNYDTSVIIYFSCSEKKLEGELRIDRIEKHFNVAVKRGDETILPAFGDWPLVKEYLDKVLA